MGTACAAAELGSLISTPDGSASMQAWGFQVMSVVRSSSDYWHVHLAVMTSADVISFHQDMNEELESQDRQLSDLQDHAEKTLNDINEVEATTRRDFKLREAEGERATCLWSAAWSTR